MQTNFILLSSHVEKKLWGGHQLAQIKNLQIEEKVGETWEISSHKAGPTVPSNYGPLSYLVKLIETTDHLSIQVHPDDSFALKHENDSGKDECWLILEAKTGAGIYLGLKPNVTKEDLCKHENIDQYLNFVPVRAGDFFVVPAGTVHAIGKDILLCEIQQSSGVTYRVWDWNRLDDGGTPRELHVDKAMQVINFDLNHNKNVAKKVTNILENKKSEFELFSHRDFEVKIIQFKQNESREIITMALMGCLVLEGNFALEHVMANKFNSLLMLNEGKIHMKAYSDGQLLIVKNKRVV